MFDIESTSPYKNGTIEDKVSIIFSKHIDKSSVVKNIVVIKDVNRTISCKDTLLSSKRDPVIAEIDVDGREVHVHFFAEPKSKYVVLVSGRIRSIDGDSLLHDYITFFYSAEKKRHNYSIIYPVDGEIVKSIDRVEYSGNEKVTRILIASDPCFSNILMSGTTDHVSTYVIEHPIRRSGEYYIRVGSNNNWSKTSYVYVDQYVRDIESTDIEYAFVKGNDNDVFFDEACGLFFGEEEEYIEGKVLISGDYMEKIETTTIPCLESRVSNVPRVLIEFSNTDKLIKDIDRFSKSIKMYRKNRNDESEISEINISSVSYIEDRMNNKTIFILDISR